MIHNITRIILQLSLYYATNTALIEFLWEYHEIERPSVKNISHRYRCNPKIGPLQTTRKESELLRGFTYSFERSRS